MMERFTAADLSFVFVTQNVSAADVMGRLTLNMYMSFAEFERSLIAERQRDKTAALRRDGKWTAGPVPFGYWVIDKKPLVNEVEAQVIHEAFTLFLRYRQMAMVARTLTECGLLPRESSRPPKDGLRWTKDALSRAPEPALGGLHDVWRRLHPGEHPRLIDESTFRHAERILAGTSRELRLARTDPDYVLRWLLRCGRCREATCPGSTTKKNGKTYRFYRSSKRDKHGEEASHARPLPAGALVDFVAQRIATATVDGTLAAHGAASLKARISGKHKDISRPSAPIFRAGWPAPRSAHRSTPRI